jgi:hypothetical protein
MPVDAARHEPKAARQAAEVVVEVVRRAVKKHEEAAVYKIVSFTKISASDASSNYLATAMMMIA